MKLNGVKKIIFKIVQPAEDGAFSNRIFELFITSLVLLSIVCVFATTFDLSDGVVRQLNILEAVISVVFTIEYSLRLLTADLLYPDLPRGKAMIRYVCSSIAIIDLLAILPFYLPMVFSCNLLAIRSFRLLRLMRVFKLNRYFESLAAIGEVLRAKSCELLGSMFIVMLMLILSSLAIYEVEHDAQPGVFKNAFSGLWWAVATLTTVGYGDIYPITMLGRLFGTITAFLGIGLVAIPTGIISSGLIEYWESTKEGGIRYKFRDHGIVIGWDFQVPSCVKALLKDKTRKLVVDQIDTLIDILVSFYQRQTLICLIEGCFYGIGFWLVGLPYGFLIGLTLGTLNLIPFLGSIVCLPLALTFAYFGSDGSSIKVFLVLLVWGLGQFLDGYFITPKIQGNKTGLGYAGVIFSFLFWTIFLGPLLGMLLAIPLSACCVVLWRTFCEQTRSSGIL